MATVNVATNRYSVAKYIVAPTIAEGANFTTIAAAISAASSGETIFIRPGTYSENLTLKAGVNLSAFTCDAQSQNVTIHGKCTVTFTGTVTLSGICLKTNGDYCISSTGSNAATLNCWNCFILGSDSMPIQQANSNGNIRFKYCYGESDFGFTNHSAGNLQLRFCQFEGGATANTMTGGSYSADQSNPGGPFTVSAGSLALRWCNLNYSATAVVASGTASGNINYCRINSGSQACITSSSSGSFEVEMCYLNSSTSTAISGTGEISYSANILVNGASTITSSTITNYRLTTGDITLNNEVKIISGSGSPSGSVTAPKGSLYLRTDGSSTSTRAYINTNSGTGWSAITTAS